jgi:hypothetical protein
MGPNVSITRLCFRGQNQVFVKEKAPMAYELLQVKASNRHQRLVL